MTVRIAREALAVNSALLLGMAILMLGAGLQATLLGVRATLEGFSTFVTGAVLTAYYVGYIAGSLAAPTLVQRVGHIRVFAALTATAAASILVQSVFVGPWEWALLRGISGVCFACIYVVAESWLNDRADRRSRGTLLASYMIVIYAALGAGQFFLNLADPRGHELFLLIGVLISVAVVPMALTAQRAPEFALPRRVTFRELLEISPLGTVGRLLLGIRDGHFFRGRTVYAVRSGLDTGDVATFMALGVLPAIVLQLPLGRLSDRLDRRTVLIAMAAHGPEGILRRRYRHARSVRAVRRLAQAQGRANSGRREDAFRECAAAGGADGKIGRGRGRASGFQRASISADEGLRSVAERRLTSLHL